MQLAKRVKVEGKALKIIKAIDASEEDQLNLNRFRRLCGMLRSPQLVWKALEEHDKDTIIREVTKREEPEPCATA